MLVTMKPHYVHCTVHITRGVIYAEEEGQMNTTIVCIAHCPLSISTNTSDQRHKNEVKKSISITARIVAFALVCKTTNDDDNIKALNMH